MNATKIYLTPETTTEAIKAAREHPGDFFYLAGGTDALVNAFQGNKEAACLIDITQIEALKEVRSNPEFLSIGSLVKLDDLKKHPAIVKHFPALIEAAHEVASPMLRKMATLGGNVLCENRCSFYNQSEWWREAVGYCLKCGGDICIATGGKNACFSRLVSDTVPVLISAGARIEVEDTDGIKEVDLESIYTGDGVKPRNLSDTALLRNIKLPVHPALKIVFKKLRPRQAVDFTSLTTAVSLNPTGVLRIVLGGVDPKPVVVTGLFTDDKEGLIKQVLKQARVINNDYYSRVYRRDMIRVFLEQSFSAL